MQNKYNIRSDFADELITKDVTSKTYTFVEKQSDHICSNYIRVLEEENELGKEIGDYVTIEFKELFDHELRDEIVDAIYENMQKIWTDMHLHAEKILVVGLGNRFITSDALGPEVANEIMVTAHLYAYEDHTMLKGTRNVAVLQPGVMGQTGIESFAMVKSIAQSFQPDLIIAVDALATKNTHRINRAVQINNTGIQPGSGVGNHRQALSQKTLGIPVIAIGVATVTSIAAILSESLAQLEIETEAVLERIQEQNNLSLVVTPKSMDDELRHLTYILARSINKLVHPEFDHL